MQWYYQSNGYTFLLRKWLCSLVLGYTNSNVQNEHLSGRDITMIFVTLALFLLLFLVLQFAFSIINGNGTAAKNWWQKGEGLGTLFTYMTSGGNKVDVGEKGPHSNNILDFIIEHSTNRQDLRCSRHVMCSQAFHAFATMLH